MILVILSNLNVSMMIFPALKSCIYNFGKLLGIFLFYFLIILNNSRSKTISLIKKRLNSTNLIGNVIFGPVVLLNP